MLRFVSALAFLVAATSASAQSPASETIFGYPMSEGAGLMAMSPTRLDDPSFRFPQLGLPRCGLRLLRCVMRSPPGKR